MHSAPMIEIAIPARFTAVLIEMRRDAREVASAIEGGLFSKRRARRVKLHVKKTPANEAAIPARASERPTSTAASSAGRRTESVNSRRTAETTERTICGHQEIHPHFQSANRSCLTAATSDCATPSSAARSGRERCVYETDCVCERCERCERWELWRVRGAGRVWSACPWTPLLAPTSARPSADARVHASARIVRMVQKMAGNVPMFMYCSSNKNVLGPLETDFWRYGARQSFPDRHGPPGCCAAACELHLDGAGRIHGRSAE